MRILYVFPHPDDESFGPAPALSRQRRQGHEVHLLTLTKGGATRQRHTYGYSVEQMGDVREQEMHAVAAVLDLTTLTVLDLPDSGLKELDPRHIEHAVAREIERRAPDVVVTYAVHGVSGFHDHLVTHAVVKRVFCDLRDRLPALRRCAFFTLREEDTEGAYFPLSGSKLEEIDCAFPVEPADIANACRALDCYVTFQATIEKTGIKEHLKDEVVFELFQERHDPPLADLFDGL
jgi:hypothetical protein